MLGCAQTRVLCQNFVYSIYTEKFETNISREYRFIELQNFELQRQSLEKIGSSYRRLRIRIVEANTFKVKAMKH